MPTLAELIAEEVRAGKTVTFTPQPNLSPWMIHVSVTDVDGSSKGYGDCVVMASDTRKLLEQVINS